MAALLVQGSGSSDLFVVRDKLAGSSQRERNDCVRNSMRSSMGHAWLSATDSPMTGFGNQKKNSTTFSVFSGPCAQGRELSPPNSLMESATE